MKAHIAAQPRCALLWRFGAGAPGYDALARAAKGLNMTLRAVGDGDLAATVGDLCRGLPSPAYAPLIALPDRPAVIISGLRQDNGELDAFVEAVKASGAELPIRAAVTPTSKGWTLLQLIQELNAEHDAVAGGGQ